MPGVRPPSLCRGSGIAGGSTPGAAPAGRPRRESDPPPAVAPAFAGSAETPRWTRAASGSASHSRAPDACPGRSESRSDCDQSCWPPRLGSGAKPPSESLLGALGLDALAEGEPEAVAALGTLLHVCPRLGLLLACKRLGVREADAPAAFLDREHEHLDLAVHREGLAQVGAAIRRELCGRH